MSVDDLGLPQKNDDGPPVSEGSHLKKQPSALEARLEQMDPELKSAYERAIADKYNAERKARERDESARKSEEKLNELMKEKQDNERRRLEEDGKFKELAEKAENRVKELETKISTRAIRETVSRELLKAGALDEEFLADALIAKYNDVVRFDGESVTGVSDVVARLKEEKPLLFKLVQSATPEPVVPQLKPTGSSAPQPQAGTPPSKFNALDKSISIDEVERQYREANRHLGPNIRGA